MAIVDRASVVVASIPWRVRVFHVRTLKDYYPMVQAVRFHRDLHSKVVCIAGRPGPKIRSSPRRGTCR
ncbi:hypothetical protein BVI434_370027 [Burkholderia vietnamiensis]|nr:hypothetical protein BVI434_370027 [Burkholderia vietnamiensis]